MKPLRSVAWANAGAALVMTGVLAACTLVREEEPPPLRRPTRAHTGTPSPTPTPTMRPPLDESPLDEYPAVEGVYPPPLKDGVPPMDESTTASTPEPESMLTRIKASTPPNVAAAYRLIEEGRRRMRHGDLAQAMHPLERSIAVDPMNPYGYYFLALIHSQARKYDQAIAFAGRAAALAARADRVFEAHAFTLQGSVYERVGRYVDARVAYSKALRSDPRNSAARLGLGRVSGQ